jgi:cellulose synthase/poly-beta-1,6-N-acetylglucosamine synthase-like glycosyltransferase
MRNLNKIFLFSFAFLSLLSITANASDLGPNLYYVGYNTLNESKALLQYNSTTRLYNINSVAEPADVIQRAVRDLISNGGGTIQLYPGSYLMKTNIKFGDGTVSVPVQFRGDSSTNTFITLVPNFQQQTRSGLLSGKRLSKLWISHLTLDGQRKSQSETECLISGVYVQACSEVIITDVKSINFPEMGFYLQGIDSSSEWIQQVTISQSAANFNGWDGFLVDQAVKTTLSSCLAVHNDKHGFELSSAMGSVSLFGNAATSNGYGKNKGRLNGCGYSLQKTYQYSASYMQILANSATSNKKAEFCFDGVHDVVFRSNSMTGATCLDLSSSRAISIDSNTCKAPLFYLTAINVIYNVTSPDFYRSVYIGPNNNIIDPFELPSEYQNGLAILSEKSGYSYMSQNGPLVYAIGWESTLHMPQTRFPIITSYIMINETYNPYVAIQTAIDALSNREGGVIFIRAGLYLLDANLKLTNRVHLTGDGIDQTILKLSDYAPRFAKAGFVRSKGVDQVIISNLTLDGNKQNQHAHIDNYGRYGLFTEACKQVWFDHVKIINFQGYGFDPHGWKLAMQYGQYLTLTNCVSEDNEWDGFTLDQTLYIAAINCTSRHNGRHGFNIVTGSKHVYLINNHAYDNGYYDPHNGTGCGYMFQNNLQFGTGYVVAMGNVAQNSKKSGICINDVHNVILMGNTILGGRLCYHMVDTSFTEIENNTCTASHQYFLAGTSVLTNNYTEYQINKNIYLSPSDIYLSPSICHFVGTECVAQIQYNQSYTCVVKYQSTGEAYCKERLRTNGTASDFSEVVCQLNLTPGNQTCITQQGYGQEYYCVLKTRTATGEPFCMARVLPPAKTPDPNEEICSLGIIDGALNCSVVEDYEEFNYCVLKYRASNGDPFCMARSLSTSGFNTSDNLCQFQMTGDNVTCVASGVSETPYYCLLKYRADTGVPFCRSRYLPTPICQMTEIDGTISCLTTNSNNLTHSCAVQTDSLTGQTVCLAQLKSNDPRCQMVWLNGNFTCEAKDPNNINVVCVLKYKNMTQDSYCQGRNSTGAGAIGGDSSGDASWGDILSDWRIYIPFIFSFVRYGEFLLLKVIPAIFFYRQLKYKPDHELQTKDVTAVIAVHDPPPTFEDTLDYILKNNPGQIIVVGSGKFIETTRAIVAKVNAKIDVMNEERPNKRLALDNLNTPAVLPNQVRVIQPESLAFEADQSKSSYGGIVRMSHVQQVDVAQQAPSNDVIIQMGPKRLTNLMDKSYDKETKEIAHIQVIREDLRGKRIALDRGIRATKTALVALIDDDIKWSPQFLEKLIAPFQHDERIAGVGCKQVARINGTFDLWGIMADMRLAVRFLELMATTALDKGCSCLSGRTACYRTSVIQTDECYDYLVNEKFFGHKVISGDDKCLTRYVINHGHKTYHQLRSSCELVTSFETGWPFFLQMFRWARNTWRSDIKSLFIERKIWKNTPITAFIILDKMITPFIIMVGPILVIVGITMHGKRVAVLGWVIWLCFSRGLKLCYYLWEHPGRFWAIPFFVLFQYVASVARIWALCTLFEMKWGTKDITVKDGQVISDVDGKAVDDNPENQTKEKLQTIPEDGNQPILKDANKIKLDASQFPQNHVDANIDKMLLIKN